MGQHELIILSQAIPDFKLDRIQANAYSTIEHIAKLLSASIFEATASQLSMHRSQGPKDKEK